MKIYDYPRIDLDRPGESLHLPTRLDWQMLLHLAKVGGWQPASQEDFDAAYLQPEGQKVSAADARCMAVALASVLDDIPDFVIPLGKRIHVFEYFSGPRNKDRVMEFVHFCRRGAFRIT